MKITVYMCDHCFTDLSHPKHGATKNHIMLDLTRKSGFAYYESTGKIWAVSPIDGVLQFCNSSCMKTYFDVKIAQMNNIPF